MNVHSHPPTPQNTPLDSHDHHRHFSFEQPDQDEDRGESRYDRERRKEREREEELRKHQQALKEAAEENRKQQKAVRREPIAFQVEFDGGGNDGMSVEKIERKRDPVSAPVSRDRDRRSGNENVRRSRDDSSSSASASGSNNKSSLSKGSRPKRESIYRDKGTGVGAEKSKDHDGLLPADLLSQEGKGRQRRGWGQPIADPFNPSPPPSKQEGSIAAAAAPLPSSERDDTGEVESQMDSGILRDVYGGESPLSPFTRILPLIAVQKPLPVSSRRMRKLF